MPLMLSVCFFILSLPRLSNAHTSTYTHTHTHMIAPALIVLSVIDSKV